MRGLLNLGNTCFFNTAIQSLAHIPALSTHLFFNRLDTKCPITLEYQKVVKKLFLKGITDPVDPSDLLKEFRDRFPSFANQDQHDAQEVILNLIDVFETSVGKKMIQDLFNGEETQETIYPNGISKLKNTFTTMILDVTGPSRLEDLVKTREKAVGIKDYTDDTGKTHHVAAVCTKITRWPKVILFSFSMYAHKFPIEIPSEFQGRKLFACVIHKGIRQGGHYALMVMRHGKWFIKDDETVSEIETPTTFNGPFYLVLYR